MRQERKALTSRHRHRRNRKGNKSNPDNYLFEGEAHRASQHQTPHHDVAKKCSQNPTATPAQLTLATGVTTTVPPASYSSTSATIPESASTQTSGRGQASGQRQQRKSRWPLLCAADCWTFSSTTIAYLSVPCYYLRDFKLQSNLLDCFGLTDNHTAACTSGQRTGKGREGIGHQRQDSCLCC